jgi:hypothetical protein
MQTHGHSSRSRTPAADLARPGGRVLGWALLLFWVFWTGPLGAEGSALGSSPVILLLVEDPGCPYCARWDRDVGPAYARSAEGRFAPLVRRYRGSPDVGFLDRVVFSPTFVVLKEGQEVGRIVGYSGPDFFWSELSPLLVKAGFPPGRN